MITLPPTTTDDHHTPARDRPDNKQREDWDALFREFFAASVHGREKHSREESRYRQMVELSPEAVFVYRKSGLALLNQAGVRLLGARAAEELLGRSIFDFIRQDHHALFYERLQADGARLSPTPFVEQVWVRPDGSEVDVEIAATNLKYDDAPAVQVVVRDITRRKRAEAIQLGQNRILSMIASGMPLADILADIARFAERHSACGLCSIVRLQDSGKTLGEAVAPSLPPSFLAGIGAAEAGPGGGSCGAAAFRAETVTTTDIASAPEWRELRRVALAHGLAACAAWPILGRDGKVLGTFALYYREPGAPAADDLQLSAVCTDLARIALESRASDEKIRHLAHYDGLTSLPNRFLFEEYLDLALRNARRQGRKCAVFFLDLDKFKDVNDMLGHDAGDRVLREIAARLRSCLRHSDRIARMGGDEFYVLIEELNDARYAADVAQKLLDAARRPIRVDGQECRLGASIGIAVFPGDGADARTLLENADRAMYRAKNQGKNRYRFYAAKQAHRESISPPWMNTACAGRQDNERTGTD